MIENIHWLGHASFKITGEQVIYIDPYQIKDGSEPADIILISHDHFDHCSVDDVSKIKGPGTWVVTTSECARNFSGKVKQVKAGERVRIEQVVIETVPAYNIGKTFHPKTGGYLGFIVELEGTRIYFAGDTDFIPEMEAIRADIALLPVGGTYTMDVEAAIKAVQAIKPGIAVPMHWGSIVGSADDAERFRQEAGTEVVILAKE